MSDEAQLAVDAIHPQESGALVPDESPLPEGEATLGAPVYIVEWSPSHLALHSRWYAPLITLAPIATLGLPVLAIVCAFVWVVLADPMKMQLAMQPQLTLLVFLILGVSMLCIVASILLCWNLVKRHTATGPIHFNRDTDQLLFGQLSQQQTRLLSAIAGLQLMPTTVQALLEVEASLEKEASRPAPWQVRALLWTCPSRRSWQERLIDHLAKWWESKSVVYQLNLVFADSSRLNLTDWKKRPPIQALAQRLAEFLNVPLTVR